jgi:16S rRNA processing protein RimM
MRAGRVGRPHGLDGSFHVVEAEPRALVEGTPVEVGSRPARIVARKGSDARPIVRLDAAADRTAAEALRGTELVVPDDVVPPLGEDEYWAEELVGCLVVADDARELGRVRRLLAYPSCELLELDDGTLVPLVHDCVREVDVAAKRIEVDGGFLGAA